MGYLSRDYQHYSWAEDATFGATGVTHQIMGPKGKVGFVRDIQVEITTSGVGSTTVPEINVGISSGDYTFGRYRLGTAAGTAYGTGVFRASQEPDIAGNPPRVGGLFSGHVVLDGGPLTSMGVAGGSWSTQVPAGRIPMGGLKVTNVISGTGSTDRIISTASRPLRPASRSDRRCASRAWSASTPPSTGCKPSRRSIRRRRVTTRPGIEVTGLTFSGTYTSGGTVIPIVIVTCLAGTGGSPAGGGIVRVSIDWQGQEIW